MNKKLDEIQALCAAATPGPWKAYENGPWGSQGFAVQTFWNGTNQRAFATREDDNSDESGHDAIFIAQSRTLIPKLLQVIRVQDEALEFYAVPFSGEPSRAQQARAKAAAILGGGE